MAARKSANTNLRSAQTNSTAVAGNRFVYHGNAVGAAGRIIRIDPLTNLNHVLPSHASSTLPVMGGRSECVVDAPYELRIDTPRTILLFGVKSARTLAEAPVPTTPGVWITNVHSEAHGLRLLDDAMYVDHVVADITSEHRLAEDFPRITILKSEITGMKIAGKPVEIKTDLLPFQAAPTKASLEESFQKDPKLRGRIGWCEAQLPAKKLCACHVVAGVSFPEGQPGDVTYDPTVPNRVAWKGVGTIFLGELLIGEFSRRFTMLRVALGCPIEGDYVAGEVETNGHTFP